MTNATPPRRPQAPLPSSFDSDPEFFEESRFQKAWRRLREEPLIPLGTVLTCFALLGASNAIKRGASTKANAMFRRRIYAQGFTVAAMVGGSYYWKSDRTRRKEYDRTVEDRKAAEKRDQWLRELEARDREDREFEERLAERGKALERKRREEGGRKKKKMDGTSGAESVEGIGKIIAETKGKARGKVSPQEAERWDSWLKEVDALDAEEREFKERMVRQSREGGR